MLHYYINYMLQYGLQYVISIFWKGVIQSLQMDLQTNWPPSSFAVTIQLQQNIVSQEKFVTTLLYYLSLLFPHFLSYSLSTLFYTNFCYIFIENQHLTVSIMKSNKNKNWEWYMLNELYSILSCVKTYIHNDIWQYLRF